MAAKKTMSSKEILQSDALFSFWERLQAYLEENARQLMAIGLVIVVLAAGIGFWKVSQSRTEKEALNLYYDAMKLFSSNAQAAVDRELAYGQALEIFTRLGNEYDGTQAGQAALFYAGSCCYNLKRYDEALGYFKEFLDGAGRELDYLKPFAYESLGYVHEAKGEYGAALEWYEKQKAAGQSGAHPLALLNLARCYEASGDSAKACEQYTAFVEQKPLSSFKDLAETKVAQLCN